MGKSAEKSIAQSNNNDDEEEEKGRITLAILL